MIINNDYDKTTYGVVVKEVYYVGDEDCYAMTDIYNLRKGIVETHFVFELKVLQ